MSLMARNPSASNRLAEKMEDRRVELRLQWSDVAKRGEVSYESIRQARNGKKMSSLIEAGIERGLSWRRGSIREIRAGGEPTAVPPEPTASPPVGHEGKQTTAEELAAVFDAIQNLSGLVPEGKEHLWKQVGLLLRIEASKSAAAAVHGFDEELERRIAAKSAEIRAERSMTSGQQERLVDIMEAEERAKVPAFDGRRNPHLDVRFEESGDDDLSEDEAAAALAEESQVRERQTNGC